MLKIYLILGVIGFIIELSWEIVYHSQDFINSLIEAEKIYEKSYKSSMFLGFIGMILICILEIILWPILLTLDILMLIMKKKIKK